MVKSKSLVNGIGNLKTTIKYYDDWSNSYDITLKMEIYCSKKKYKFN